MLRTVILIAALVTSGACANNSRAIWDEPEDIHTDLVHSDLPLFAAGAENVWPRNFYDDDRFGCISMALGDWRLTELNGVNPTYYRFTNYGVFHCWTNVAEAFEPWEIDTAEVRPAFFVLLDEIGAEDDPRELWAIQIGARPGSDYLLLSRSPATGPADTFELLQTRCPTGQIREGPSLDILLTRYCAVNTQSELIRLARRMAELPPVGRLVRQASSDQQPEE